MVKMPSLYNDTGSDISEVLFDQSTLESCSMELVCKRLQQPSQLE